MKRIINNIIQIEQSQKLTHLVIKNTNRLTQEHDEVLRIMLLDIATNRDTHIDINLNGICFIDSSIVDTLNLVSRVGRKFHSQIVLTHVGKELKEFIQLVKKHAVFDVLIVDETSGEKQAA